MFDLNVAAVLTFEPSFFNNVPETGKVTFVAPVTVSVVEKAPDVTKAPPRVMVFALLFATPVPPFAGSMGLGGTKLPAVSEPVIVAFPPTVRLPVDDNVPVLFTANVDICNADELPIPS